MQEGFYKLTDEQYFNGPGLARSDLKLILRSPQHYKEKEPYTSDALNLGQALHMAVFQRDRFNKTYISWPDDCLVGSGTGQKQRKADFEEANKDKTILKKEDLDTVSAIVTSITNHPTANGLIQDGETEVTGYWYDPVNPEILCKLRADWLNRRKMALVDLKSCQDARPEAFSRDAIKYGYHLQAAYYLYGVSRITRVEHRDFYFLCVEKEAPYAVQCYKASDDLINLGLIEINKALQIYADCLKTDTWPGYGNDIKILEPPAYVKKRYDGSQKEVETIIYD